MMLTEGAKRTTIEEYRRHECRECGKPATKTHHFLLPNARANPSSEAYGRHDDISYCADAIAFTCDDCPEPCLDGRRWSATFSGERYQSKLHYWHQVFCETAAASKGAGQ